VIEYILAAEREGPLFERMSDYSGEEIQGSRIASYAHIAHLCSIFAAFMFMEEKREVKM
jgi:hypothetical protein